MKISFVSQDIFSIKADAVALTKKYVEYNGNPNNKFKQDIEILEKDVTITQAGFKKFIKNILSESEQKFKKIIIPINQEMYPTAELYGKAKSTIPDELLINWLLSILKEEDQEGSKPYDDKESWEHEPTCEFQKYILHPYTFRLEEIIFVGSKEQIESGSRMKNWSKIRKINFIFDSLDIEMSQKDICEKYGLNEGHFKENFIKACSECKNLLRERMENILSYKYGSIKEFPIEINSLSKTFSRSGLLLLLDFVTKEFPPINGRIKDSLDELEDGLIDFNKIMGGGDLFFHYIKHLLPQRDSTDKERIEGKRRKNIDILFKKKYVTEVYEKYALYSSIIKKIRMINGISKDLKNPIFPLKKLIPLWHDWLISGDSDEKAIENIEIEKEIFNEKFKSAEITIYLLSKYYNKSTSTIKDCIYRT